MTRSKTAHLLLARRKVRIRTRRAGTNRRDHPLQLQTAGPLDEVADLLAHYWDTIKPGASFLERLANMFRERGQADRAIELYKRVLEVAPDSASARQALTDLGGDLDD